MKRVLQYSLLGLLAYGFFMLVQFPASALANWTTRAIPGLTVQQVSGSAIQGSARDVRLKEAQLASLTWQMRFLPLLLGRLEYRVNVSETGVQLDANVGTGFFNSRWWVTDIEGQLPMSKAWSMVSQTPALLTGEITFAKAGISWDNNDGAVYAADGTIRFLDTLTTALGDSLQIGSFNAELSADTPDLLADLEDSGGPLEFSGMLRLAPTGRYQLVGSAGLRDNADNRLRDALDFLGQPSGDDQWQLEVSDMLGQGFTER